VFADTKSQGNLPAVVRFRPLNTPFILFFMNFNIVRGKYKVKWFFRKNTFNPELAFRVKIFVLNSSKYISLCCVAGITKVGI
jgi:hypothetical protein